MNHPIRRLLERAGIEVNGSCPWDIQVHDNRFWNRVLFNGQIGLGDAYMNGWWDCQAIDQMINKVLKVVRPRERRPLMKQELKVALLESSALEDIDHMMDLPDETVLEQMEAHKADFLPMCWESIRKDDMTPNEMLARCYNLFCRNLESFRKDLLDE